MLFESSLYFLLLHSKILCFHPQSKRRESSFKQMLKQAAPPLESGDRWDNVSENRPLFVNYRGDGKNV